jgi:hypothetical protein
MFNDAVERHVSIFCAEDGITSLQKKVIFIVTAMGSIQACVLETQMDRLTH